MKKNLLAVILAVVLAAVVGVSTSASAASAQAAPQTWSIVAHFEYWNGFSYDYVVATGVDTAFVTAALQACGAGHAYRAGSVVRFHCFPVPE